MPTRRGAAPLSAVLLAALVAAAMIGCNPPKAAEPAPRADTPPAAAPKADAPAKIDDDAKILRKGDAKATTLAAGITHEWGVDLDAGEKVVITILASSTGQEMCQSWSWSVHDPSGGALRDHPMIPDESGHWEMELEQVAEGSRAGRYLVRVSAGSECQELTYTLKAR